jgi:CelD/BcsL family acetyltransferase involved in cellulose biosynthesis
MPTIRSTRRFEEIGAEWDALASRSGQPTVAHDWLCCAARAFHQPDDLEVVTVRSGGRLVAAAPLARVGGPGGERLEIIGMSGLHEPGSLLFADDDALAELVAALSRIGRPIHLHRLPADSPASRLLAAVTARRAVTLMKATRPSLFVPTAGRRWEEYAATLSSHVTVNLRRLRRKAAEREGEVTAELLTPEPAEVPALFDVILEVEASGWKGRRGSSLRDQARLQAFFRDYACASAQAGRLRVAVLRMGGRAAAVELSVERHGRMWQLKIGFADGLGKYYPGLLLLQDTLRSAFERGLDGYEFLGSAEDWERRWRPESRPYHMVVLYPVNLRGFVGFTADIWSRVRARLEAGAQRRRGHVT